jgi:hypothetical protein
MKNVIILYVFCPRGAAPARRGGRGAARRSRAYVAAESRQGYVNRTPRCGGRRAVQPLQRLTSLGPRCVCGLALLWLQVLA